MIPNRVDKGARGEGLSVPHAIVWCLATVAYVVWLAEPFGEPLRTAEAIGYTFVALLKGAILASCCFCLTGVYDRSLLPLPLSAWLIVILTGRLLLDRLLPDTSGPAEAVRPALTAALFLLPLFLGRLKSDAHRRCVWIVGAQLLPVVVRIAVVMLFVGTGRPPAWLANLGWLADVVTCGIILVPRQAWEEQRDPHVLMARLGIRLFTIQTVVAAVSVCGTQLQLWNA